jgi:hypothetical protein
MTFLVAGSLMCQCRAELKDVKLGLRLVRKRLTGVIQVA